MLKLLFTIHTACASILVAADMWGSTVGSSGPTGDGSHDRGASLVEYSLLLAMIAVVCIGAVTFFGGQTADVYSGAGSSFN